MALRSANIWFAVAAGGALGASLRWLISLGILSAAGPQLALALATLAANMLGSLALGVYIGRISPLGTRQAGELERSFVLTGFFGGFTSLSLYSMEAISLWTQGSHALALALVIASPPLWVCAAWLGLRLSGTGAAVGDRTQLGLGERGQ